MWALSKHSAQLALANARLEALVLQRTAELQILSQRLLKVQDEERRKLSRDLHDSTGQILAALKISVSFLQEESKATSSAMVLASEVAVLADQAIEEIRTMSYLLHPPLLDEVGFACAAEWYVEGFAKRTGIKVTLDIATSQKRLPLGIEVALFRVLQESLTNVHRHSGASAVSIYFQHQLENIVLEVRDDGLGIPPERLDRLREASAETGVGLAGMRERMNELNGKLEIQSQGRGTTMRALVPRSVITESGSHGDCRQVIESAVHTGTHRRSGCGISNTPVSLNTCKRDKFQGKAAQRPWKPKWPDMLERIAKQRAKSLTWYKGTRNIDLAALAAVVVVACWIAYSDRQAPMLLRSSELRSAAAKAPVSPLHATPAPVVNSSEFQTVRTGDRKSSTVVLQPIRLATEIVNIGEDVTLRYFTPNSMSHGTSFGRYQVVHKGEDVTVRYFTPGGRGARNRTN